MTADESAASVTVAAAVVLRRKAPPEPVVPPTMGEAGEALANAAAALERAVADLADRTRAAEVLAATLAEAEALAAEDALADPGQVGQIADRLVRRRAEQDVAHRATTRAAENVDRARRGLLAARAVDMRSRAARLREVAAGRQARTDQLVAELLEHEGVAYVPGPAGGGSLRPPTKTRQLMGRAKWLDDHAAALELLAREGGVEQVATAAAQPAVEPIPIEAQALAAGVDEVEPANR